MAADWAADWAAWAVIAPLAAALACVLLGRRAAPAVAAGLAAGTAAALGTVAAVWSGGAGEAALGGWAAPLGIRLRADGLAAAFLLTAAVVMVPVAAAAWGRFRPDAGAQAAAFWPLAFFVWAGLNAAALGADLFNLYVALELVALSAVALAALEGTRAALEGGLRYLTIALLGSLAYLLGAALLYADAAGLDLAHLRGAAPAGLTAAAAFGLMTAGLMAKTASFPAHGWLPPAHGAAPPAASALLSALVVKASFIVLLRLWFEAAAGPPAALAQLLGALGAGAVLFGGVMALRQRQLKLVVAWSTVAQLGYLPLAFPLGTAADGHAAAMGWTGAVLTALAHAPAKAALFLAAGVMARTAGDDRLEGMAGVGRRAPVAAFAFGLAAVSLMGLPPTGGFIAKYLLVSAAIVSGQWWWAVVAIGGGLLTGAYLFRALGLFMAQPVHEPQTHPTLAAQAPALALAVAAAVLGLTAAPLVELLQIGRWGAP